MSKGKKKRSQPRKHRISESHLGNTPAGFSSVTEPDRVASTVSDVNNTTFVRGEVRRVLVLAGIIVGIEIVLWWLLDHTAIGPHVYNLVKL